MAAQAGARVPEVLTAGLWPDGDALLVTRQADADPLESTSADGVSDATLEDLWRQVALPHNAGISHGWFAHFPQVRHRARACGADGSCVVRGSPGGA